MSAIKWFSFSLIFFIWSMSPTGTQTKALTIIQMKRFSPIDTADLKAIEWHQRQLQKDR